ncbi:MAG: DNA-3-methyladenine glycosylase [Bacteroidetes bacterium CG2_30_33_31]|nr:MAG: DNA-3-methyladenine glycosylase [Bacteroidetes bacterium CG2_30_33_31]
MNNVDKIRCAWVSNDELYKKYHDEEWGIPVYDDKKLFEFIILEGFQAGLSWLTILRKRENFRIAFNNFDYNLIAKYDSNKIEQLMNNEGIIRNRLKINAAITNAQAFISIQKEFGSFSKYIWDFVGGKPIQNNFRNLSDIPAHSDLSDRISKDLKKRGFKFVGTTIIYAHCQATGMVKDHLTNCFLHPYNINQ